DLYVTGVQTCALPICIGGAIPLVPWFITKGTSAVVLSVALGAIAAIVVGALLAQITGRSPLRSALRQLLIAAVAATVTFAVGKRSEERRVGKWCRGRW